MAVFFKIKNSLSLSHTHTHTHMQTHTHTYIHTQRGARDVMVIVVGNGHDDMSSNPRRDW